MDDAQRRELARWVVDRQPRAGIGMLIFIAVFVTPYLLAVANGYGLAKRRLPESLAALEATQPAPLPPERNAWFKWRAASLELPKIRRGYADVPYLKLDDPEFAKAWDAGSPLRTFCASTPNFVANASAAASVTEAVFGLNYATALPSSSDHYSTFHSCARALRAHALLAAHEGDWQTCLRALRALAVIPGPLMREPDIAGYFSAVSASASGFRTIRDAAAVGVPDAAILTALAACVTEAQKYRPDFVRALRAERSRDMVMFDAAGCGRLDLCDQEDDSAHVPPVLLWYTPVYTLDRDSYFRVLDSAISTSERSETWVDDQLWARAPLVQIFPLIHLISKMKLSALAMIMRSRAILAAESSLSALALDARLFRLEHGHWPTSSTELPQVSAADLVDPCASPSAQFDWHILPSDTLELRSVGRNGRDERDVPKDSEHHPDDLVLLLEAPR